MPVVVTPEQRANKDPVMQEWVRAKDKENATTVQKPMVGPILGPESSRPTVNVPVTQPPTTPAAPQNGTLQGPYPVKDAAGNTTYQQGMQVVDGKMQPNQQAPAAPVTPANPGYDLDGITKTATDSVNAQIAAQIAAYNQQVASAQQGNNLALSQNNNYLTNALKSSGVQHTIDSSNAQTTQNRRGGFYSGGLDFQLGSQDRAYATAEGNLRQDVQTRNDDIYAKNALLASQAASNIQMLQNQAPAMIRQAIQEEIDRQRGINIQEAGLTGQYNGKDTMAQANSNISNNIAEAGLTGEYTPRQTTALQLEMASNSAKYAGATPAMQQQLHARNDEIGKALGMTYDAASGKWSGGVGSVRTIAGQNADRDQAKQLADLTGYMSDGRGGYVPTNAKQQQDLTNAWKQAEELGAVTPALAALTGIKAGTPTQTARNQAIQNGIAQQNATNSKNNMDADNTRADNALELSKEQKTFAGEVVGDLENADSEQDIIDYFKTNAAKIAEKLGPDTVAKLKKDALAPFQKTPPVVKTDPEVARKQEIRDKAIAAAQKEFAWKNATKAEREAMIKDFEDYYN